MKVYLDDERRTPPGWKRVYWPDEAIRLLQTGRVTEISLDHDLGDDDRGTGYDVILWIEEQVALHGFDPPDINVHSANNSAAAKMWRGVKAIERLHQRNQRKASVNRVASRWFAWSTIGGDSYEGTVIDDDSGVLSVACTDGVTRVVQGSGFWYHGSPKRFDAFEVQHRHTFGDRPSDTPLFFTPEERFAKMYANGPHGTIYKVELKWRNVFDSDDLVQNDRYWPPDRDALTPAGQRLFDDLADGKVFSGGPVSDDDWHDVFGDSTGLFAQILRHDYDVLETTEFKRWLRRQGYDAFYVRGDGPLNVAVFSPKQVTVVDTYPASGRTAAGKFKDKKEVPKADGKGTTTVYEYSDRQVQHRNREKAKRLKKLDGNITKLRQQYKKDLKSKDAKTKHTALAVALIDCTYERVGNDQSAKDGHFGVTGWKKKHITFSSGKATLKYVGKSGVDQTKTVTDKTLISVLKEVTKDKGPEDTLCSGPDCTVKAGDVNAYLKPYSVTAKDLRGYHANAEMRAALGRHRKGKLPTDKKDREQKLKDEWDAALEEAAAAVGHEPSTLKNQYLVPDLEDEFLKDGTVKKASRSKTAIIHISNAYPDEHTGIHAGLHAYDDLTSSLTMVEMALVNDMHRQAGGVGYLLAKNGEYTYRGYPVDEGVVTELQGAGYLGDEHEGVIELGPMFQGKLQLYSGRVAARHLADERVYALWKLLDDIDTASDICKGDDQCYRDRVHGLQEQRWDVVPEEDVDDLYDRFHQRQANWPPPGFTEGSVFREPLYHGSSRNMGQGHSLHPGKGSEYGIYLSPKKRYAKQYGSNLHMVLVAVRNPKVVEGKYEISPADLTRQDIRDLESQGFDSIVVTSGSVRNASEVVLFRPEQAWVMRVDQRLATKSKTDKEDESSAKLVKPSPKKKPPRQDLRKRRLTDEDKDLSNPSSADNDRDLSLNYKRVGYRRLMALRIAAKDQKALKPGKARRHPDGKGWQGRPKDEDKPTQTFDHKEQAEAYAEGRELSPKEQAKVDDRESRVEDKAQKKQQRRKELEQKREERDEQRAETAEAKELDQIHKMDDGALASLERTTLKAEAQRDIRDQYKNFVQNMRKDEPQEVTPESLEAAREELEKDLPDPDEDPTGYARAAARKQVLRETTFNPLNVGGTAVSATPLEPEALKSRAEAAFQQYSNYSSEERNKAAQQLVDHLESLAEDDPQREEVEHLLDGIAMAAIVNDDDPVPGRPAPTAQFREVCKAAVRQGKHKGLFGDPATDHTSSSQRALFKDIYDGMSDDEFAMAFNPEGDAEFLEVFTAKDERGKPKYGQGQRQRMREYLTSLELDNMSIGYAMALDAAEANDGPKGKDLTAGYKKLTDKLKTSVAPSSMFEQLLDEDDEVSGTAQNKGRLDYLAKLKEAVEDKFGKSGVKSSTALVDAAIEAGDAGIVESEVDPPLAKPT